MVAAVRLATRRSGIDGASHFVPKKVQIVIQNTTLRRFGHSAMRQDGLRAEGAAEASGIVH